MPFAILMTFSFCLFGKSPLEPRDIYYEVWGRNLPQTVIFVHGLDSSGMTFYPLLKALSQKYQVILYDQRGHGRTPPKGTDYSSAAMAEDLELLREHLGIKQFYAYGHSLGARTVMAYAAAYPSRVKAIAIEEMDLFARHTPTPAQEKAALEKAMALKRQFPNYSFANETALRLELTGLYGTNSEVIDKVVKKRTIRGPKGEWNLTFRPYVSWLYAFQANADDFTTALQNLKVPLLVLRADGAKGSAMSDGGINHILRHFKQAKVLDVPSTDHNIHESQPEMVTEVLSAFFAEGGNLGKELVAKLFAFSRTLASLPDDFSDYRTSRVPSAKFKETDAPKPLQERHPKISAIGVDAFREELLEVGALPRGTAVLSEAGIAKSPLTARILTVLGSGTKKGSFYEPNLDGLSAGVRNGLALAKQFGYGRVALPILGSEALFRRMGTSKERFIETTLRSALQSGEGIEIVFTVENPGDGALVRDYLTYLDPDHVRKTNSVLQCSVADFVSHQAKAVFQAASMDLSRAGLEQASELPPVTPEVEEKNRQLVTAFNQDLKPLLQ